ncbi:interleukin-21 receptor-like [Oryzias latipes]|uniref:interleukin-21 receptor-like n=1 Tax=Oryzias latipes TaxID=8090 RepID=UPI0005CC781D|nr:interleukin-21 receptor-like [Oryzias latipes]
MKRGRLLFALWCFSIQAGTVCPTGLTCVSDYYQNISCTFDALDQPSTHYLTIKGEKCPLTAVDHKFRADCRVFKDRNYFSTEDKVDIYLCNSSSCRCIRNDFFPSKKIKLTPPDIKVQHAAETIKVTTIGTSENPYLEGFLEFQMALQRSGSSDIRNAFYNSTGAYFTIERSTLQPGAQYCVKVRLTVQKGYIYEAVWSDWSRAECWTVDKEQDGLLIILVKTLGPVGLSVVVLLSVCCSPTARMKLKTLSHTPTPATFFQPLFQQDKKNLQEWFSKNRNFVLAYKTEEDLRADSVTVVPRTTTKEREEIVPDSSVTPFVLPMAFPVGQLSYVGLPGFHEAPAPVLNAGDGQYTQLPCPAWEFGISEGELASSSSESPLEISNADSGCSCEGLSSSPDCSLPSSPFGKCVPLQFGQDYCILNKTTEGVVPVLVSKIQVSSDVLQEKDPNQS